MSTVPVLLVHGLGSSFVHNWRATGWVDLVQMEGREVLAFELPGHGKAPGLDASGDPATRRLLDQLPKTGKVDAVGFSAGARLVLDAVVARPDAFRRVALLGIGDSMWNPGGGADALADQLDSDRVDPDGSSSARLLMQMIRSAGNDVRSVAAYARAMTALPALDQLGGVAVPVLVVLGDRDPVGPADRLVGALPQGRLVTLRGVDHFATTSSFQCQDEVLRFLE